MLRVFIWTCFMSLSLSMMAQIERYNLAFRNGILEENDRFCVDLSLSFNEFAKLGSSNLVFDYDGNYLANPTLENYYLSGPPFYQTPVLSQPAAGRVSLNIELSVEGFGDDIEMAPDYTNIGRVCFDRVEGSTSVSLSWFVQGTFGTVVFIDDEATQLTPDVLDNFVSVVLPAELVSFHAEQQGNDALLRWETDQAMSQNSFEIERSVDGRFFKKVGVHEEKSLSGQHYHFLDRNITAEGIGTYYYRLRQLDPDGKPYYSSVAVLELNTSWKTYVQSYPQPFNAELFVEFVNPEAQSCTLRVLNSMGQEKWNNETNAIKGRQQIDTENWAAGVYFLQVHWANKEQYIKLLKKD